MVKDDSEQKCPNQQAPHKQTCDLNQDGHIRNDATLNSLQRLSNPLASGITTSSTSFPLVLTSTQFGFHPHHSDEVRHGASHTNHSHHQTSPLLQ